MATYFWGELTRAEIADLAPRATTILPVASTEQHGPHMATVTDTALLQEVVRRACTLVEETLDILVAPVQPYGSSDHHLPFGGTLSLRSSTLRVLLADLLRSLSRAGCSRVLLLNGHGGNAATCRVAADEAAREEGITVIASSYWELIEPPTDPQGFPGHAGRFETSLMLAVRPDLVHLDRAVKSPGQIPPRIRGLSITPPNLWQRIDGFTDDPRLADPQTGEALISRCAAAMVQALRAIADL